MCGQDVVHYFLFHLAIANADWSFPKLNVLFIASWKTRKFSSLLSLPSPALPSFRIEPITPKIQQYFLIFSILFIFLLILGLERRKENPSPLFFLNFSRPIFLILINWHFLITTQIQQRCLVMYKNDYFLERFEKRKILVFFDRCKHFHQIDRQRERHPSKHLEWNKYQFLWLNSSYNIITNPLKDQNQTYLNYFQTNFQSKRSQHYRPINFQPKLSTFTYFSFQHEINRVFLRTCILYIHMCANFWRGQRSCAGEHVCLCTHVVVSTWSKHSRAAHGLNFALILNFLARPKSNHPWCPLSPALGSQFYTDKKEKGKEITQRIIFTSRSSKWKNL